MSTLAASPAISSPAATCDHITIVNNTLFKNNSKNTGSGEFQIQYHATNNLFENNIVYAASQALLVNEYTKSTTNPVTLDYNLYYSPMLPVNSNWVWQAETSPASPITRPRPGKTATPFTLTRNC